MTQSFTQRNEEIWSNFGTAVRVHLGLQVYYTVTTLPETASQCKRSMGSLTNVNDNDPADRTLPYLLHSSLCIKLGGKQRLFGKLFPASYRFSREYNSQIIVSIHYIIAVFGMLWGGYCKSFNRALCNCVSTKKTTTTMWHAAFHGEASIPRPTIYL
eukprot:6405541-Amphidinium_carterae.1